MFSNGKNGRIRLGEVKPKQEVQLPAPMTKRKGTRLVREALIEAAVRLGNYEMTEDGKKIAEMGRDGLVGFCMNLAVRDPRAYAQLLGRMIPLQVTGEEGGPVRVINEGMTLREAADAYAATLRAIPGVAEPDFEIELGPDDYERVK